jgi:hypothetical protein
VHNHDSSSLLLAAMGPCWLWGLVDL